MFQRSFSFQFTYKDSTSFPLETKNGRIVSTVASRADYVIFTTTNHEHIRVVNQKTQKRAPNIAIPSEQNLIPPNDYKL